MIINNWSRCENVCILSTARKQFWRIKWRISLKVAAQVMFIQIIFSNFPLALWKYNTERFQVVVKLWPSLSPGILPKSSDYILRKSNISATSPYSSLPKNRTELTIDDLTLILLFLISVSKILPLHRARTVSVIYFTTPWKLFSFSLAFDPGVAR